MSTVLIVDDEPDICSFVEFEIQEMGHQTYVAYSGQEALEVMKTHKVDFVVSDILMPKMDGVELLKETKKLFPRIKKFIFMSGFTRIDKLESQRLGADALLGKPLDMEKLKTLLS